MLTRGRRQLPPLLILAAALLPALVPGSRALAEEPRQDGAAPAPATSAPAAPATPAPPATTDPAPTDPTAADAAPEAPDATEAEGEVEVASRTPLTTRDAPGVVTLIQRDEIERTGARDLIDILHTVPGFSFGVDVQGVVSVGFRGIWGHEGKVLLLLDGMEMNETLYSTIQLGLHVPAAIIERVEIIRGPGSAVYGGFSELAVINVVTRDARSLQGAAGSLTYGQAPRTMGHVTGTASYAGTFPRARGLQIATNVAYSEGARSDRTYYDFLGQSADMAGNSRITGVLANVSLGYKGFKLRFLYDDYRNESRDGQGSVIPLAVGRFETVALDARYEARLTSTLTLTPRLSWKRQTPWQTTDYSSTLYYDKTADRALASLQLGWTPHRMVDILVGAEGTYDHAHVNDTNLVGLQTLFADASCPATTPQCKVNVDYGNIAGYAQVLFRNPIVNVIAGARYEYHSRVGGSFVPRVGLTKVAGRFNVKLLYSQAFRPPGIENLNASADAIVPERTNVAELELGVQASGHLAFSVNGYWMRIDKPIVYNSDPMREFYYNGDRLGSLGVETQARMKYAWGFANLNYSYYYAGLPDLKNDSNVSAYAVPGDPALLLGFPAHKLALNSAFSLWRDHVTLGISGVLMSERKGYLKGDGMGKGLVGTEPATLLANVSLTYHNLGTRGLDLTASVFNLLDQPYRAIQPYNGGHAPLPMQGREVMLRISYSPAPRN